VAKETGISNADLICLQKLSGILSQRDVELYQMANFNVADCIAAVGKYNEKEAAALCGGFGSNIPVLPLEKRAAYANVDTNTFIYGATATVDGEDAKYGLSVEVGDEDTLIVRVTTLDDNSGDSFTKRLTKVLHGLMTFRDFARTFVFKQYVRELQINSVV
jgi:hypothetical protein